MDSYKKNISNKQLKKLNSFLAGLNRSESLSPVLSKIKNDLLKEIKQIESIKIKKNKKYEKTINN